MKKFIQITTLCSLGLVFLVTECTCMNQKPSDEKVEFITIQQLQQDLQNSSGNEDGALVNLVGSGQLKEDPNSIEEKNTFLDTMDEDSILKDILAGLPKGANFHIKHLETTCIDSHGNKKKIDIDNKNGKVPDDVGVDPEEYKNLLEKKKPKII